MDLRCLSDIKIELDGPSFTVDRQEALICGVVREFCYKQTWFDPSEQNSAATLVRLDRDGRDGRVHSLPAGSSPKRSLIRQASLRSVASFVLAKALTGSG